MSIFKKLFKKKKKQDEDEGVVSDGRNQVAKDDDKNSKTVDPVVNEEKKSTSDVNDMISQVDTSQMSFKEKAALKLFQKMPKKKQEEVMRQAMNPKNVQKNKEKILAQIDEMVASGQIDKSQIEAVKSRMGLR